jgi:hypothetical protein
MSQARSILTLKQAALVFAAGFLLHNLDHGRRGLEAISEHVIWSGTLVAMVAAVTLTLVFTDHPLAPAAAAVAGVSIAFGVAASHLLPDWSAFSDELAGADVDAATWVAVLAEIGGALVLGLVGLAELRRQGLPAAQRS